ncbi:MAG: ArsR family transcriptional regulator [Spirochaetes bacterium GWD1_61_31]|nr:MAG: ArsR family transcriptional regulator [Spirochaetes bacterium GWB1_60_80]OHD35549.1 MAG: ArsR family transcriptional regulator [Spirochaetes bacterium GWD1_61_31]OHD57951.1 MAG: ArsR family transcriptional regulator [Spirochaetes bacterium GWF1_60_12]
MTEEEKTRYELQSYMFKALAHPVRIQLLDRLKTRSWCVCELAVEVGIDKSVASKHLSQLKEAGLIDDEKRGTQVEYRLVAPCVLELANCAVGMVLENRKRKLGLA